MQLTLLNFEDIFQRGTKICNYQYQIFQKSN